VVGLTRGTLGALRLRWQNDQGAPVLDELQTAFVDQATGSATTAASSFFSEWLLQDAVAGTHRKEAAKTRSMTLRELAAFGEARLAAESSRFKHPNGLSLLVAGDFVGGA